MSTHIIEGDAFDIFPTLAPESFDAVATDPPYSSGGKAKQRLQGLQHCGKYFKTDPETDFDDGTRDQLSHHQWTCDWMRACHKLLKPGGWIMCFTDWRQLPLVSTALQCSGYIWQGINIWAKPNGLPQLGRFFRSAEFILLGTKGQPAGGPTLKGTGAKTYDQVWTGSLPASEKYHATAKPVALMRHLLQVLPPGGRVLDPFAGGGATLVAAEEMGLDAVGIEKTHENYMTARERLKTVSRDLFAKTANN